MQIFRDRQLDRKHLSDTDNVNKHSAILFESYQLIKSEVVEEDNSECCWKKHSTLLEARNGKKDVSVLVRHLTGPIMFEELLKFNNTGNVCKFY